MGIVSEIAELARASWRSQGFGTAPECGRNDLTGRELLYVAGYLAGYAQVMSELMDEAAVRPREVMAKRE